MAKNKNKLYNNSGRNDGEANSADVSRKHEETERIPLRRGKRLIKVYVEGYSDVAFWRGIFDDYESSRLTFEISVPSRGDLAKGKKTVLRMAANADPKTTLFCVDSDFDYLFANQTELARFVNNTPNVFHTYAYSIENFLCYAPSLHNICVKATKNDTRIFDFVNFMRDYSNAIFPLFLWYAYSAQINVPSIFPLIDLKSSVKINYLELDYNGRETILWLERQVERRVETLRRRHPEVVSKLEPFASELRKRGVSPDNTYLFMQGHTLLDNVVMPILDSVCDRLKRMSIERIQSSQRRGVTLENEKSNYNNALQDVRTALVFNENYKDCYLYLRVKKEIETYIQTILKE